MSKIVFTVFVILLCAFATPTHAAVAVGQPAPALSGVMLDGQKFDTAAMKGKVVVVHFWATWCTSCTVEMPILDAYYRRHRNEGVEVIAVSADRSDKRDDVAKMMKPFAFPAAMLSDLTANGYGLPPAIPLTFVIDRAGILRAALLPRENPLSEQELSAAISPYLGSQAK